MRKALVGVGGRNVKGEFYVVGEEAVIGSASLIVPTSLLVVKVLEATELGCSS